MAKHYLIGGSAIARIIRCPGSVRLSAPLQRTSSAAADRGTMLHKMAEIAITKNREPHSLIGYEHAGQVLLPTDAKTALMPALAAYRKFVGEWKAQLEVRVKFAPKVGGTADIVAHHKGMGLVGDFKFGFIGVNPNDNEQMLFYAGAAVASGKLPQNTRSFRLAIIQPAARPVLQEADTLTPMKRVVEFSHEVMRVAKIAMRDDAPLVPGDTQCQWCPAKAAGTCPAVGSRKLGNAMQAMLDAQKKIA